MSDKITFKKLAELTLEKEKRPLTPLELWEKGKAQLGEKIGSSGKTPWNTISAQIYVDIRDNSKTPFYQYSSRPMKFYLKKFKEDFKPEELPIEEESEEEHSRFSKFHEEIYIHFWSNSSILHQTLKHLLKQYFMKIQPKSARIK